MICLYPDCPNTSRTRGLCHGHYQLMRSRVREGRVTEQDLEQRGLLTPKGTGGTPVGADRLGAFETGSTVRAKPEHDKLDPMRVLPADWRCPRCKVPRMGATVYPAGAITCANGHDSY